jgi:hypothetical protein
VIWLLCHVIFWLYTSVLEKVIENGFHPDNSTREDRFSLSKSWHPLIRAFKEQRVIMSLPSLLYLHFWSLKRESLSFHSLYSSLLLPALLAHQKWHFPIGPDTLLFSVPIWTFCFLTFLMSALLMGGVYFFEAHWYTAIILYGTTTQKVIYVYISMKMSNIMTCFFSRFKVWTGFQHRISRSSTWIEPECNTVVWWLGEGRHPGSASRCCDGVKP